MTTYYIVDSSGVYRGTTQNSEQNLPDGWSVTTNKPNIIVKPPKDKTPPLNNRNSEVFRSNFFQRNKVQNWVRSVFQGSIDAEEVLDFIDLVLAHKQGNSREFKRIAQKHQLINIKVRVRAIVRFRVRKKKASLLTTPGVCRARLRLRVSASPVIQN